MKYTIEVEVASFDSPHSLAEMKREGNVWKLRIDADKCGSRRELNELVDAQLRLAGIQLAATMTAGHVWPT